MIGQFVDIDAAIGEHTLIAIDVADAGIRSRNAFQSLGTLHCRGHSYLSLYSAAFVDVYDCCRLMVSVQLCIQWIANGTPRRQARTSPSMEFASPMRFPSWRMISP